MRFNFMSAIACVTLMHISPQCAAPYLNAYASKTFKTSKLSNGPDYMLAQISEPNLIPILNVNSQTTSDL